MDRDSRHIALYMPTLGGGGAERVMLTLSRAFAEGGDRVDLLVANGRGAYRDQVPEGVRLIDLGVERVLRSFVPLVGYMRRERPDALLSTQGHANIVAVLARYAARVKTPVLVREASTVSHNVDKGAKGQVMLALMRATYPRAQGVIAISSGVGQSLSEEKIIPTERITTIYNPVEIDAIEASSLEEIEHPWMVGSRGRRDLPLLLAVGRLTEAKDFPNLLQAMKLLQQKVPSRLLVLGEGEKRAELEALIKELGLEDRVSLPGFVSNPYAYMARADVCVLSSRWEGLGNVVIEALAVGAKVVSTDCPSGPSEILEGGTWGRLVPVNNPPSLARALAEALADENAPDPRPRARDFDYRVIAEEYRRLMPAR